MVEREQAVLKWAAALVVGAVLALGLKDCSFGRTSTAVQTNATGAAPASQMGMPPAAPSPGAATPPPLGNAYSPPAPAGSKP